MLSRHRLLSHVLINLLTSAVVTALAAGFLILPPTASAQNPDADPNFGSRQLYEGFMPDPISLSLTAGGIAQPTAIGCGYGYISQEPDFELTYSTSGFSGLYFYVEGEGDTTLLIRTPSGGWLCDDDDHGNMNPIVDIPNAAQGAYQVWAGAYSSGYIQATLYVSERYPAEATSPPPANEPPAAGISEACPDGLRTVEDPLSEAPNLSCTDLAGARLGFSNLTGANLEGANLEGAELSLTYLNDANLTNANLSGANLNGTDLSGANLSGANLSGIYGLFGTIWTEATYNSATQFPPNFDPAAEGMILRE